MAGPVPTGDMRDRRVAGLRGLSPHMTCGAIAGSRGLSPHVINKVLFEENGIGVPTDCIKLS